MVKCPFCQFENEDGALFCEQCKSDLAGAEPLPMAQPIADASNGASIPVATPMPEAIPIAADAVASAAPPQAVPVAEPLPEASTFVDAHPEPAASPETFVAPSETFVAPIPAARPAPEPSTFNSLQTMAASPVYATPGLGAGAGDFATYGHVIRIHCHGTVARQCPATQNVCPSIQGDACECENISREGSGGAEGRRTPDLPKDIGTFTAIVENNRGVARRCQRGRDLENEDRIRIALVIESECSGQLCRRCKAIHSRCQGKST